MSKIKIIRQYDRYIIVDRLTGKILDNAQGYGYKTPASAYRCWNYKYPWLRFERQV